MTTIMVTHDQEEALSLADRIVVMNKGRIEQVGTPTEIYDQPATRFVADFVGAMNFLTASMSGPDAVRLGDLQLSCRSNGHAVGEPVTLASAPRTCSCVEDGEAQGPNLLEVQVGEVEFLGPHVRARLLHEAFENQPLFARTVAEPRPPPAP